MPEKEEKEDKDTGETVSASKRQSFLTWVIHRGQTKTVMKHRTHVHAIFLATRGHPGISHRLVRQSIIESSQEALPSYLWLQEGKQKSNSVDTMKEAQLAVLLRKPILCPTGCAQPNTLARNCHWYVPRYGMYASICLLQLHTRDLPDGTTGSLCQIIIW